MHRIVDLVSRMADACRSADSPRSLEQAAAAAITDVIPDSAVLLVEIDGAGGEPRTIACSELDPSWPAGRLPVAIAALIAEALRHPARLVHDAAPLPRESLAARAGPAPCATAGVMPAHDEPARVVVLLTPAASADLALNDAVLRVAIQMLAANAAIARREGARLLGAIHRAKLEWEQTADALPEIVGMLDDDGRVVRVSRALERWSLGNVRTRTDSDLHRLLHPSCQGTCALHEALDQALADTRRAGRATFEIADRTLGLDLVVILNAASGDARTELKRTAFSVGDITSLRHVERELTVLNRTLEARVEERTADLSHSNTQLRAEIRRREEAERQLLASHRELELLPAHIANAQELERQRIAQDLHDSVGQSLSAIKYALERAQVLIHRQAIRESSDVIGAAVRRAQRLIAEVRTISMNLRPALLDDLGAASAVRSLCRDWQSTYQEVALEADIDVADGEIPGSLTTTIFRVVQESLHNVARHAHARHVRVAIHLADGFLSVVVQDDGDGFTVSDETLPMPPHFGLRGLRERTERSGGRYRLVSAPGRGTTVDLQWPVEPGSAARSASQALN